MEGVGRRSIDVLSIIIRGYRMRKTINIHSEAHDRPSLIAAMDEALSSGCLVHVFSGHSMIASGYREMGSRPWHDCKGLWYRSSEDVLNKQKGAILDIAIDA